MKYTVFDIETDGLLETVTRIHCLSYQIIQEGEVLYKGSITNYEEIKDFILQQEVLVGHNIILYDVPVLEKILDISVTARLVDTLGLSWYLYPTRPKHGLEGWGNEFLVPKPHIADWNNLHISDYINRCETDVEINKILLLLQLEYLTVLYADASMDNIINYISFKLDCVREQERIKCKLDKELVGKSLEELTSMKEEKETALTNSMPRDIRYKEVSKPSKLFKKDGEPTVRALKWYDLLDELGLSKDSEDSIMVEVSNEPGNPSSHIQIKSWLYSLGWEPTTFEHRKNTAGDVNAVPQIYGDDGVCESIKALYDIEPALENLDMLSLVNHRIGVFKSYLDNVNEDGYVTASMHGLTNTLRLRHRKPITNLPSIYKFYGEQIRGAIIAPSEEHVLCGSDMSSLEDTTKQHYMYFFDPEYVKQMRIPGFDPHLDIAVLANMLTEEQSQAHKDKEEDYSEVRKKAKVVNFAGVYGAGPPKIALTSGMSLDEAKELHTIYWKRNKSVKQIEKSCKIKPIQYKRYEKYEYEEYGTDWDSEPEIKTSYKQVIDNQIWLFNPVSKFWYSLRYMKDRFSTLNQGTGVYVFDMWIREVRAMGVEIMIQYHDEIVISLKKGDEERVEKVLKLAIKKVNDKIKLNVPLDIDVQFGTNYAEIH